MLGNADLIKGISEPLYLPCAERLAIKMCVIFASVKRRTDKCNLN